MDSANNTVASDGNATRDEELLKRLHREGVVFMEELHELGHRAAREWIRTATFRDVLYVKASVIDRISVGYDMSIESLADNPVIGKHLLSLLNDDPLLASLHHSPGYGERRTYLRTYSRIIVEAWFDELCALLDDLEAIADGYDLEEEEESESPVRALRAKRLLQ